MLGYCVQYQAYDVFYGEQNLQYRTITHHKKLDWVVCRLVLDVITSTWNYLRMD